MPIMKGNSMWKYTFIRLRRNYLALIGFAILLVLILTAVFAEQLAPYGFADQDYMMIRKPPTAEHLLGTDEFGRDVLSPPDLRLQDIVAGGADRGVDLARRRSAIGAAAGYFGGKMDNLLMRVMDVQLAIPTILLAIVISSALGPGLFNLMVAWELPPYRVSPG